MRQSQMLMHEIHDQDQVGLHQRELNQLLTQSSMTKSGYKFHEKN